MDNGQKIKMKRNNQVQQKRDYDPKVGQKADDKLKDRIAEMNQNFEQLKIKMAYSMD